MAETVEPVVLVPPSALVAASRVEAIVPVTRLGAVVAVLRPAAPNEELAHDVIPGLDA